MSISSQRPSIVFTANGVTTTFTYPFKAFLTADIDVYLNGVIQASGYTITMRDTDGDVVFSSAPANGVEVIICRDVGVNRSEVYTERGSFLGTTVNNDFDRRQMLIQEIKSRSVLMTKEEAARTGGNLELPTFSANKLIGWGEDRELIVYDVPEVSYAESRLVKGWAYSQSFALTSITRNANNVITTASITWPDGATGTLTTDTINEVFNAIDAWHATHTLNAVTLTVTQPLVTRNANGKITAQPAITIS